MWSSSIPSRVLPSATIPPSAKGAALAALYVASAPLLFALAWMPVEASVHRFLYEDFFYYLTLAQNTLRDHAVTLDGVEPTNGFHPLWFVLCALVRVAFSAKATIHVMLTIAALLHAGQSWLFFRLVSSATGSRPAAHAAALFWLFNYRVIACNLCGLETPLAVFSALCATSFLLRAGTERRRLWAVQLGALLLLCALSRFDLLLFDGFAIAAVLVSARFGASLIERSVRAGTAAAVLVLGLVPWFAFSLVQSGTLLPNSRRAVALMSGHHFSLHASLAENASVLKERVFGAAWWFADTGNLLGLVPWVRPQSPRIGLVALAITVVLTVVLLVAGRKWPGAGPRAVFSTYAWVHLAYYASGFSLLVRYLLPFCAAILLTGFTVMGIAVRRGALSMRSAVAVYVILFGTAFSAGVDAWRQHQGATRTHEGHRDLLAMALWVRANVPAEARLGSWNSGIMSYFSGHSVTNLDGVVNDRALGALENRALFRYVKGRQLDFLVDQETEIEGFMSAFAGDPSWRRRVRVAHRIGTVNLLALQAPGTDPSSIP